ncbi:hypothetical protein [Cohaesibacter intestini]|uniref:hypothetical protein n=1 Tax=Cohaesibacter intestini TaxID=2211145 RepID=UPI000DEBE78A|nr:hypothetical protein [Cohaesibacter intestini]
MRYVVYRAKGSILGTFLNEDQDVEQMLDDGLLPFSRTDDYRILSANLPEWPIEHWGSDYLETGTVPYLRPYEPVATSDEVNAERDRRIAIGRVVTLTSGKVIPIQGRSQDQTNPSYA